MVCGTSLLSRKIGKVIVVMFIVITNQYDQYYLASLANLPQSFILSHLTHDMTAAMLTLISDLGSGH